MLTSSQPLTTRTDTSRPCYPVWPCLALQPLIPNFESFMHHTKAKKSFVLSWSMWFNCKRVWKHISSMNCHWRAHRRSKRTFVQQPCVPSATRNSRTTRWDIMHMWQVNTPQGMERYAASKPGSTSAPVVPSAIYNLPSIRRTIDYQSTSTMGRTTIWVALRFHVHHEAHRSSFNL